MLGALRTALLMALLVQLLSARAAAYSGPAFDVASLRGSADMQSRVSVLSDPAGKLGLADVQRAYQAGRFAAPPRNLTFGFTTSATWLRVAVVNKQARARSWLLEAGHPMLDFVTLYIVHPDGRVERREAGDMRPFSSREVADTNFAFELESAPGEPLTCYLRLQTSGSLRLTLVAWEKASGYLSAQHRHHLMLWMFYGALSVMLLFNMGVYALVRLPEYLVYSALLVALWAVQFTMAGHTSQYLLSVHPELANRVLPVAITLVLVLIPVYAGASLGQFGELASESSFFRRCVPFALALLLFACVAPLFLALRVVLVTCLLIVVGAPVVLRRLRKRGNSELNLYFISWYCLLVAVPLHAFRNANLIPPYPLSDWVIQIGITLHGVMSSLAVASRLKLARDQLGALNGQLSSSVVELKLALSTAEQATEEARRATRVKDEFVATMSHELRTPLNAIINVPQGLLDDFPELQAATCSACSAGFLLDPGERLDAGTCCPDCQVRGSLRESTVTKYQGEPAHTARFLRKIERSGKHLLDMVNGVLDFSKMEAGRLSLSLTQVEVGPLLGEVIEQMGDLARRKQLTLTLSLEGTHPTLVADPVRLKQILLNLIANAIKFSEPLGNVQVSWQSEDDAELFSVSDRGIGIAPGDHERIFASFEQVHQGDTRKYGGTGLGLSISRSLVRMHGGELWVESELGQGATFRFRLPIRASVVPAPGPTSRAPIGPHALS